MNYFQHEILSLWESACCCTSRTAGGGKDAAGLKTCRTTKK